MVGLAEVLQCILIVQILIRGGADALENPYAYFDSDNGDDGIGRIINVNNSYRYLLEFDNNVAAENPVELTLTSSGDADSNDYLYHQPRLQFSLVNLLLQSL
jgi:hypothetical protein